MYAAVTGLGSHSRVFCAATGRWEWLGEVVFTSAAVSTTGSAVAAEHLLCTEGIRPWLRNSSPVQDVLDVAGLVASVGAEELALALILAVQLKYLLGAVLPQACVVQPRYVLMALASDIAGDCEMSKQVW